MKYLSLCHLSLQIFGKTKNTYLSSSPALLFSVQTSVLLPPVRPQRHISAKFKKIINSLWATENVASPATIFCIIWNIRSYEYEPRHICLWITENVASHATKASHLWEVLCSSVLITRDTFLFVCKKTTKYSAWFWIMMTLYIFVCMKQRMINSSCEYLRKVRYTGSGRSVLRRLSNLGSPHLKIWTFQWKIFIKKQSLAPYL